ncbi:MAG: hypothetical protein HY064_06535 [Bacteroidetes bacterium]|nr:hypothetical protein [Bacteroidota bacterium]
MKKIIYPCAILMVSLIVASCNFGKKNSFASYLDSIAKADSMKNNAPATSISFKDLFDSKYADKNVTVEGYLALCPNISLNAGKEQVDFRERKGMFHSDQSIKLNLTVGDKKNGMDDMPDKYHDDDMKVYDNSGNELGVGAHVRITGHLDAFGSMDIKKIESISNDMIDYSKFEVEKIDADNSPSSSLDGKLVSAEGTLEMPESSLAESYTYLYLHVKGIDETVEVHIRFGHHPNQIESLPPDYGDDDVKVHANDGTIIGHKKVRVYGVYSNDAIEAENIEVL